VRNHTIFLLLFFSSLLLTPQCNAQESTKNKTKAVKAEQETKKASKNNKQNKTNDNAKDKSNTQKKKTIKKNIKINFPIDSQKQFKADINHYLNAEKIKPMLAGSDDFITLINEQSTGNSKGVAILLANWQQALTSPKALNYLRTTLPKQGWTTITIQSPEKPAKYPSIKLNALEQAEENQTLLSQYKEKLSLIIKKVMLKADNYPGISLMIAEGSNAALLVDLYQQQQNKQPAALVILSGYLLTPKDNQNYAQSLAKIDVPVLDLYLEKGNAIVARNAPLRLSQSKKQLKVFYRQQKLNNFSTGYYPKEQLSKVINGWLKRIGY